MRIDHNGITRRETTYTWGCVLAIILNRIGLGRLMPPPF